jgi:hypothetical protein
MMNLFARLVAWLGVKKALFLSIVVSLAIAGLGTGIAVSRFLGEALEASLRHRGESDALAIAALVGEPLRAGREDLVARLLAERFEGYHLEYAVVLRADLSVAAQVARERFDGLPAAISAHTANALGSGFRWGTYQGFTQPVRRAASSSSARSEPCWSASRRRSSARAWSGWAPTWPWSCSWAGRSWRRWSTWSRTGSCSGRSTR